MQQFYMPNLSKTNKYLLIILGASFLIHSIAINVFKFPLTNFLGLSLVSFFSGFIFQIFTYPFANTGLMDVVFSGLLLWFLGSELESIWGSRKYFIYLVSTVFFSGLIFLLVSAIIDGPMSGFPFHGMSVLSSAMCVSYAVHFPDRVFQFFMLIPIKAKYFCMILAGMSLYTGFFTPGAAMAFGNLGAMIFGFAFIYLEKNPLLNAFMIKRKANLSTKKSHLRVVPNDDEKRPPRYFQ